MQRIRIALLVLVLGIAGATRAADKHDHLPRHGGVVVEVKDIDYELVAMPDLIRLHVSDHGKMVDLKGASAKLTLLAGAEKQEVALVVVGDRFEAQGAFAIGPGTKAVAVVSRQGRPAQTVRFVIR